MVENRGKLQTDSKQRTEVFSVKVHEELHAASRMCKSLEVDSLLSRLLDGSLEGDLEVEVPCQAVSGF